jgi:hypothetical protein
MHINDRPAAHLPTTAAQDISTVVSCERERDALAALIRCATEATWTHSSCRLSETDSVKQYTRFDYFDPDKRQKFLICCTTIVGAESAAPPSYYALVSEPHGILSALSLTEDSVIAPIFAQLVSRYLSHPQG